MRLPISLLALTAFLVGCSTDEDPAITQTIMVTSTPNSAVIRLNGSAVGRTPGTITVESNSDYQLEIGKGGFAPSLTELKPSLKTDSKGNMYYGFPERIAVTLDRLPGSDDVKVPAADEQEFKKLSKVALGVADQNAVAPGSAESKAASVTGIKDDVTAAKNKLEARDGASAAKIEGLKKALAEAKAADGAKPDDQKIAALEAQIDAQEKAIAADRQSTATLLKALDTRTEELIRIHKEGITTAKAEEKTKAEAAKELEEQKAIAAKEAEEKARAEADKQLASVQRIMEEQKILAAKAEELRAAAEQQRAAAEMEAKKRAYADFSSRYALLESRRRNKLISEDEFKEQLGALRKELTK